MKISNSTPESFLKEHIGLNWNSVVYDEHEFGMLGEEIAIMPATQGHPANGYQSGILTDAEATRLCAKLGELGITNPGDFTRIGVGNSERQERTGTHSQLAWKNVGATEGVTLVFKTEAMERVMHNAALIQAALETPLMDQPGMRRSFADTIPSTTLDAQRFLTELTREVLPNVKWVMHEDKFSLPNLDAQDVQAVQAALKARDITAKLYPASQAGGDLEGAEIEVSLAALQHELGQGKGAQRA